MSQQQRIFRDVPCPSPVHTLLTINTADIPHNAFITHLDRSPVRNKVYVFLIPLAFNLLFAGIFIWRTFSTGLDTLRSIPLGELIRPQATWNVSWPRYIITLFFDLVIYIRLPRVLLKFATGHLWMRLRYGFRPVEVVFRKPTGPQRLQMNPQEAETVYANSILHAMDASLLNNNVGYKTRDGIWVLDYKAAIDAYKLAQTGEVSIETWELSVWQKNEGKWCVWPVHEQLQQKNTDVPDRAMKLFMQKLYSLGRRDILEEWAATLRTRGHSQVTGYDSEDVKTLEALRVGFFDVVERGSASGEEFATGNLLKEQCPLGSSSIVSLAESRCEHYD